MPGLPVRRAALPAASRRYRCAGMITGLQIRRARERLGWSVEQLGRRVKLRPSTIERAEGTPGEPPITVLQMRAIQAALESAGIEFSRGDEPAVKLKRKE